MMPRASGSWGGRRRRCLEGAQKGFEPQKCKRSMAHAACGCPVVCLHDQVSGSWWVTMEPSAEGTGPWKGRHPLSGGTQGSTGGLWGWRAGCTATELAGEAGFPTFPRAGLRARWPQGGARGRSPTSISDSRLGIDPDPENQMISSVTGKSPITEQIN